MNLNNYNKILQSIPDSVHLVVVSKFQPVSDIQLLYNEGQRLFGENRPLEMFEKHNLLPSDIKWHFIGHLQTNKIKFIIDYVDVIHSIDSFRLLEEVNKEAAKINRVVDVLLEFHIADEFSKQGFLLNEVTAYFDSYLHEKLKNVNIAGVMGMATLTGDYCKVRNEFDNLRIIFDTLKNNYFFNQHSFNSVSMGMSNDYLIAVEAGANIIRVGTAIFANVK